MSATGYIQVRAYTSTARFPLENVAIAVTATDGTALAMRLTDRNGLIAPIELPVPDKSESQAPEAGEKPYTTVNLYARLKGYEQIEAENSSGFRRYHHQSESGDDSSVGVSESVGSDGNFQHASPKSVGGSLCPKSFLISRSESRYISARRHPTQPTSP